MDLVKDTFDRSFRKLRISLTHECNFSCTYCVNGGTADKPEVVSIASGFSIPSPAGLDVTQIVSIVKAIHDVNPLQKIRLTGGEPLLYPHIIDLVEKLRELNIAEIDVTTNGYHLPFLASPLKKAGVGAVNISLDALDERIFYSMSNHRNVSRVVKAIDTAVDTGLKVKINTVVMRGVNENQVVPLLEFAFVRKLVIRYLELMKMGHLFGKTPDRIVFQDEILDLIGEKYQIRKLPREHSSTSNLWEVPGHGIFGIVANESQPFCGDCDRLRLDSKGRLYGCISSTKGLPVAEYVDKPDELRKLLAEVLRQKQPVRFQGSPMIMKNIGG